MLAATLALTYLSAGQATTYKIVEIDRKAVFAGKLGDRVHESLVVEREGQRYTITLRGEYHTRCVRPSQRLREGDEIRLSAPISGSSATIARDRISRIRG